MPSVRVGVDVGGTFTKAAALADGELIGQAAVPTTHYAPEGVAAGVLLALDRLLADTGIDPRSITLVAHSTTQATNALLEGDVSPVGIVALGPAAERGRVLRRLPPRQLELAPGKHLATAIRFLETDRGLREGALEAALDELVGLGCRAIVASGAFSVEDPRGEQAVVEAARRRGLPATAGSELTGVYGLEVRTTTAAINAGILPRMIETAEMVERSVRERLAAPVLILKGDGGVATMETFRTQPLLTLFSGPAAGLSGALKLRPLLHGLFLEVGGTSSNIGLARGGQVALRYARIGDFATCVRAADMRVAGVAGGSLIRLRNRRIEAVGPRSAHIARLPYASFTPPDEIVDPELVFLSPLPGDPDDYAVVRTRGGRRVALTPTCAANALGLVPQSEYAQGSREAARRAFEPLARHLGSSVETAASALLARAARQVAGPIRDLLREHRLRLSETTLLVGGGGASVLGPAVAAALGVRMERVPHSEVISSIGAALAMIRIEREQALAVASPAALSALREAVEAAAVAMGASPETLAVETTFVPERSAMRAVATASLAFSPNGGRALADGELRALAARALGVGADAVDCCLGTPIYSVFRAEVRRGVFRRRATAIAVIDRRGSVPLVLEQGVAVVGSPHAVIGAVRPLLEARRGGWGLAPELHVVLPNRLVDLSSLTTPGEILAALSRELEPAPDGQDVALVVSEE